MVAFYPVYQQAYGPYGGAPTLPALATPTGAQATATSSTALSVTASGVANATGYQLYTSATQTGTYAKLGGVLTTPSYSHTGLSAGQTQWYKWVAVGNGTSYRDSAPTAPFSGTTSAASGPAVTNFSPAAGVGGDSILVTGSGFTGSNLAVTINNAPVASVVRNSDTSLTIVLANNQATGKMRVTVGGQTGTSANDFTVLESYLLSSFPNVYDEADLSMESQTFGRDSTAGIQAVLDTHPNALIRWDVKVSITNLLIGDENTQIRGENNGGYIVRPNTGGFAIRNRNAVGMNQAGTGLATRTGKSIVIRNLIHNMNGWLADTPQQPMELAPGVGPTQPGGWTMGVRIAGVDFVELSSNTFRNQRTFCAYVTNADTFIDDNNSCTANKDGHVNSDGIKAAAVAHVRASRVSGKVGDDLRSYMGADIFYPTYPAPSPVGGGQTAFDPYAVWAAMSDIQGGTYNFDSSEFGLRLGSSTIETKLDNVILDKVQGTISSQGLIIDNYSEAPANFFAPSGPRPGYFGYIYLKSYIAEKTALGRYKPANIYVSANVDWLRIGYLERHNYVAHPSILIDTAARVTKLSIDSGSVTPTTSDNQSIIDVAGWVGEIDISNFTLNRSAFAAGPAPIVRLSADTGRIDKIIMTSIQAQNLNNIIENYYGSIGEIVLTDIDSVSTAGVVFIWNTKTVNKITANNFSTGTRVLDPAGGGTVTTQAGNAPF